MRSLIPALLCSLGTALACLSFPQQATQQAQSPRDAASRELHAAVVELSLHPDSATAMAQAGWLLAAGGEARHGIRWLKRAFSADPALTRRTATTMQPIIPDTARELARQAWNNDRSIEALWLLAKLGSSSDVQSYGALWHLLAAQSDDPTFAQRRAEFATTSGRPRALSTAMHEWGRHPEPAAAGAAIALAMSAADASTATAFLEQALAIEGRPNADFLPMPDSPLWDIRAVREWVIPAGDDVNTALLEFLRATIGGDMERAWRLKLALESSAAFTALPADGRSRLMHAFAQLHEFWKRRTASTTTLPPKEISLEHVQQLIASGNARRAAEVLAELVRGGASGLAIDLARLQVLAHLARNDDAAGTRAMEGLADGIRTVLNYPTLDAVQRMLVPALDRSARTALVKRVAEAGIPDVSKALISAVLAVADDNIMDDGVLQNLALAGVEAEIVARLRELSARPPEVSPADLLQLGDDLLRKGEVKAALAAYQKAALGSEEFLRVARSLLAAHLANGDYLESVNWMKQILDSPREGTGRNALGVRSALTPAKLGAGAVAGLSRWAASRPADEWAWLLLALVYDDFGDKAKAGEAAAAYRKISRNPRPDVANLEPVKAAR